MQNYAVVLSDDDRFGTEPWEKTFNDLDKAFLKVQELVYEFLVRPGENANANACVGLYRVWDEYAGYWGIVEHIDYENPLLQVCIDN